MQLPSIFTEKVVGLSFAIAFGLWAWMLSNLAGVVLQSVHEARAEQITLRSEIVSLKAELTASQLRNTEDISTLRARQNDVLRRIDRLEEAVDARQSGRAH